MSHLRDCHDVPGAGGFRQRLLGVASAAASARARADVELTARIRAIHQYSHETYGAPRVHQELRAAEIHAGCKRVARLIKAASVRGASRRPWVLTTVRDHDTRPAPDLFHPNFVGSHPTPWGLPISLTFRPGRAFSTWRWSSALSAGASPAGPWPLISAPNWSSKRSTWPLASAWPAAVIHHSDQGSQGGFKRSSQHLGTGSCDGYSKAPFRSMRASTVAVAGAAVDGFGRRLLRQRHVRELLRHPRRRIARSPSFHNSDRSPHGDLRNSSKDGTTLAAAIPPSAIYHP